MRPALNRNGELPDQADRNVCEGRPLFVLHRQGADELERYIRRILVADDRYALCELA